MAAILGAGLVWYAAFSPRRREGWPSWSSSWTSNANPGRQDSQAPVFRCYAQELGLDMARYDAAVADEMTRERIRKDVAAGTSLGVKGIPTLFLDGKKLVLNTEAEFRQTLTDAAQ
ncbi:DsbA family protein [uncultured Arthrobacter sp.]|uniref:DsbA family protein n=1 Tax=uncultured Arthrobacter sp. TaxID=114050 RepID=UPI003217E3F7